jgi:hypothetical protein
MPSFAALALLDSLGQGDFLRRREASDATHLGKIPAHQVVITRHGFPLFRGFVLLGICPTGSRFIRVIQLGIRAETKRFLVPPEGGMV